MVALEATPKVSPVASAAGVAGFSDGLLDFGERQENLIAPNGRKLAVA